MQVFPTTCPKGYIGNVALRCENANLVVDNGGCYKHCNGNWFKGPPEQFGWEQSHYEILHGADANILCPQYFDGTVVLTCWSGSVTLKSGSCTKNCLPGTTMIRPGVVAVNPEMVSGYMSASTPCPA